MLKFKVIGVRRETGTDIGLVVDAIDEFAAIDKAQKLGVLVERCVLLRRPAHSAGVVRVIELTCRSCGKNLKINEDRADEAGTLVHPIRHGAKVQLPPTLAEDPVLFDDD